MLGLGALTELPVAGSPIATATGTLWVLETGAIHIGGGPMSMLQERLMVLGTGTIHIGGEPLPMARSLKFPLQTGTISVVGGAAETYKSSYQYGDTEIIRVLPEITTTHIPAEPRTIYAGPKPPSDLIAEDHEDTLEPRLRRT